MSQIEIYCKAPNLAEAETMIDRQNTRFPAQGREWNELKQELECLRQGDMKWTDLRNLKASYNAGEALHEASWAAYTMFSGDNYLYGNLLYPSLNKMAEDITKMALEMLQAPDDGFATVTTGGTESITLAMRAAREHRLAKGPVNGQPEIIAPFSAHASLNKAANLLGAKVIRVPVVNFRSDVAAMEAAISENTIALFGSAPCYPFGCIDSISELSSIAENNGLWMHVDACVGGFFLPWARRIGREIPEFDFALPGVLSMSADLHKYGYTARGASLVLLRSEALAKEFQTLKFDEWPMGTFDALTVAGSRPGGAVASAWTVMNSLGTEGYEDLVRKICAARDLMIDKISTIPGLKVAGEPEAGVMGIVGENETDMAAVRGELSARGWRTGPLVQPQGFNILLNQYHDQIIDEFTDTLRDIVETVGSAGAMAEYETESYGG
ncbi:MAG: aminotransferase class V-fold PLP-dependent enzyme [Rhizobiaceae bacterium]